MNFKQEGVDRGAFVADMALALGKVELLVSGEVGTGSGPFDGLWTVNGEGSLAGLVLDGDQASGVLAGGPIEFLRVEGRWYARNLLRPATGAEDESILEELTGTSRCSAPSKNSPR